MFKLGSVTDMISLWATTADAASSQGEQDMTQKAEMVGKRKLTVIMNWQTSPGVSEGYKAMDTREG